jgi:uncharacterized LabA/DUF88 family protein
MATVFVYIDGFNLYNGSLKNSPDKWLDLLKLSNHLLLPGEAIGTIKLFTAQVERRVTDPQQQVRQRMYWRALRTLGCVEIIEGQFKYREKWLPLAHSIQLLEAKDKMGKNVVGKDPQMAQVRKSEEKGTDVNLAAHLVHDAHLNRFDSALVISNDSDLATAISLVTKEVGKTVGVYSPQSNARLQELKNAASFYRQLPKNLLSLSQLPLVLADAIGPITKPAEW